MIAKFRKLLAVFTAASFLLVGSAGVASAKSDQWLGKHPSTVKWTHVHPASDQWLNVGPRDSRWTKLHPLSDQWL